MKQNEKQTSKKMTINLKEYVTYFFVNKGHPLVLNKDRVTVTILLSGNYLYCMTTSNELESLGEKKMNIYF